MKRATTVAILFGEWFIVYLRKVKTKIIKSLDKNCKKE